MQPSDRLVLECTVRSVTRRTCKSPRCCCLPSLRAADGDKGPKLAAATAHRLTRCSSGLQGTALACSGLQLTPSPTGRLCARGNCCISVA